MLSFDRRTKIPDMAEAHFDMLWSRTLAAAVGTRVTSLGRAKGGGGTISVMLALVVHPQALQQDVVSERSTKL
jgi:hypothetical protein